jgi:hypothetical protein
LIAEREGKAYMAYDERLVLRIYVLHNFRHLLTVSERDRVNAEVGRHKQAFRDWVRERGRRLAAHQELVEWEPPASTPGYGEFLDNMVGRVLRENDLSAPVNRCPECHCVLRTAQAKVCFWCGHSQYTS